MEMFDMTKEKPVSLPEAAEFLPRRDGKKISVRTIQRWILHGHHGVFLQGGRLGDSFCTSVESLGRFAAGCAKQTAAQFGVVSAKPARTTAEARKEHKTAKASLAKAGWGKSKAAATAK